MCYEQVRRPLSRQAVSMNGKRGGVPFAVRAFGCLAGSIAGGILGVLSLLVVMIFTGRFFGFGSVFPGAAVGAAIGVVLGCAFPTRAGKTLEIVLSNF